MGGGSTTTTDREFDVVSPFDIFEDAGFGDALKGFVLRGATGLGRFADRDFTGLPGLENYGLGPEALELNIDPFDDSFINKVTGRAVDSIRDDFSGLEDQTRQAATRAGIDRSSPAFLRALENAQDSTANRASKAKEGLALEMAKERLNDRRILAQLETQLGVAGTGANASRFGSAVGGSVNAGEALTRLFGNFPFSTVNTSTNERISQKLGLTDIIGGVIGGIGSVLNPIGGGGGVSSGGTGASGGDLRAPTSSANALSAPPEGMPPPPPGQNFGGGFGGGKLGGGQTPGVVPPLGAVGPRRKPRNFGGGFGGGRVA